MSDVPEARREGADNPQRIEGNRLGSAAEHERWRMILASAKNHRMDSVMLNKCISLAMRAPDMYCEDVVAKVRSDADME